MKNDLISRQEAIDLVHKNYDTILDFKSDGRTVASSFEDIINTLPSTQPEPCGDMISREYLKEHIEACWINGRPRHAPEFNELLSWIDDVPPAQPERLTDDDFETIRILLNAQKEILCNQLRWEEAEEYQRIIDRFMAFVFAQPEIIRCRDCIHAHDHDCPVNWGRTDDDYCSWAER